MEQDFYYGDKVNKIYGFIIITPIMIGLLVLVNLGNYVQSLLITINFINVGLEVFKVIILLIAR